MPPSSTKTKGSGHARLNLLDCTLRDGGYVNDWLFGHDAIVNIFERLVSARIDIIEVGFLDDRRPFDMNRTIFPDTASANRIYEGLDHGTSMVVAMIDIGTCAIEHIQPAEETVLDGIRVIFKKSRLAEAMAFCRQLKDLDYKVFANAVSITSYDESEYLELLDAINGLAPYTFSIVDTYGLLHRQDVDSYYLRAEARLSREIGIAYHAHNNFQLAYSNCVEAIERQGDHMLTVDGSLYAMGKSAGNAATELLAMYMNEHRDKRYDINQLLEAIDTTVLDIYRRTPWGYQLKFFIAALHDCHPGYVTYLMDKRKLSVRSINEILERLEGDSRLLYDGELIERLYQDYQSIECDDAADMAALAGMFRGRDVLLLAPGNNIVDQRERALSYIAEHNPVVVAVGFVPNGYAIDYLFLSNAKRYTQLSSFLARSGTAVSTIATSNLTKSCGRFDYVLNYAGLLDEEAELVDNPLIMLLRLMARFDVSEVALAGFDGYTTRPVSDYVNPNMEYDFSKTKALEINADAVAAIGRIGDCPKLVFVTDSLYESMLQDKDTAQ